jgi:TPR repeat protein
MDVVQGLAELEQAAHMGHGMACNDLAAVLKFGQFGKRDPKQSRLWLHRAVRLQDPLASLAYGEIMWARGRYPQAVGYWSIAAAADLVEARLKLALAEEYGCGLPRNEAAAVAVYEEYINAPYAKRLLGLHYAKRLIDPRPRRAISLLSEAAEGGELAAFSDMGDIAWTSLGSVAEALHFYQVGHSKADVRSSVRLAEYYLKPPRRADRNPQAAFKLLVEACGHGSARAMYVLAVVKKCGDGVDKDELGAFGLCRSALMRGEYDGRRMLADFYYRGVGGLVSKWRAAVLGRKATPGS